MKLINKEEILKQATCKMPIVKGVYFLINKDQEIVYVGMSNDCYERISVHKSDRSKRFKTFTIIKYNDNDSISLRDYEEAYIKKHQPKYNKHKTSKYSDNIKENRGKYKRRNKGGRPKGITEKLKIKSDIVLNMYKSGIPIKKICNDNSIAPGSLYKILRYKKYKFNIHKNKI